MDNKNLDYLIDSGKNHNKIKNDIKQFIKPNMKIIDLVNYIENNIKDSIGYDKNKPLNGGIAFPTGISINNCAAHWTPNLNDKNIIKNDDIIKIDFGIHKNGYIVDSAFTFSFDDKHNNLIEATKEANQVAIRNSGIDCILGEIGGKIQEVIESYGYKSVFDLSGHSIDRYKIHSGKAVPNINLPFYNVRMKEGEIYAIEPFATTGSGFVSQNKSDCSHYMINNINFKNITNNQHKDYIKNIYKDYLTLPFCTRNLQEKNMDINIFNDICKDTNIIKSFPPLYDIKGSFISQHEETIYIADNCVKILT
jgi:methionyl aminopeptidase